MFPALSFKKGLHENGNKLPLSTFLTEKANKSLHKTTPDDHYSRCPTNSTNAPSTSNFSNPQDLCLNHGRCNTRSRRPRNFAYSKNQLPTQWLKHKNQPWLKHKKQPRLKHKNQPLTLKLVTGIRRPDIICFQ
jgi:hypothetical protein